MKKGKRFLCSVACSIVAAGFVGTSITGGGAEAEVNSTLAKTKSVLTAQAAGSTDTNKQVENNNIVSNYTGDFFYDKDGNVVAVRASYLDCDGDGEVSVSDAVLLSRFIVEDETAVLTKKVDVDGNKKVDADDVVYILKYIAKLQTTPIILGSRTNWNVEPEVTTVASTTTTKVTTTKKTTTTTTTAKATTKTAKATTTTAKTTTTTKKATTTTAKATTTTAKATTTTKKATTTTAKATTTTKKATTTTAKATTTTAKATTTTKKATTTTAKATTTTAKATTTTAKATTTTKKATTTTAKTTTTTTKATTTTTTTTARITTTTTTTARVTTTRKTVAGETTTTSKTTTETTTTTMPTTTTTTTTVKVNIPERNTITDTNGEVIDEETFNTLVDYAVYSNIGDFDIIYTNNQIIENSLSVIGETGEAITMAGGAFWITSGEEFCQIAQSYFEQDPEYDEITIDYIKKQQYICWRYCNDEYFEKYPDADFWYFTINGEPSLLRFYFRTKYEETPKWALIPKNKVTP